MNKTISTMVDLLVDQLRDLHSVEKQLTKALPPLRKMATALPLGELLRRHAEETAGHLQRIRSICEHLGVDPDADKCKAMKGLLEGGEAHLKQVNDPTVRDLMLVAHCLRIEHYEIAAYEVTSRLARRLDMHLVSESLAQSLRDESSARDQLEEFEGEIFTSAELKPRALPVEVLAP